jgi:hypothetical protein
MNVILPEVDWTKLVPTLVGLVLSALGKSANDTLHGAFDGLWASGLNVVGRTDPAMTWGFGPVADQVASVQAAARAVLLFALVLVGLRAMLGGLVSRHADVLGELVDGVLVSVVMVAAFPLLIPEVIGLCNTAAAAVGKADLSRYVAAGADAGPVLSAVLFVVLLFFALRLLIRAVWRVMFLAVLLPVGLVACAVYAVPSLRWLLGWWARVWGGMLLAQIPSVMALSIGVQLFAFGGGGLGAFVYSIAALQLATDVYHLIPFGGGGGSHGAPWGGLPWRAAGLLSALSPPTVPAAVQASRLHQLAAIDRAAATERYYGYD